jgi:hypothetical protein
MSSLMYFSTRFFDSCWTRCKSLLAASLLILPMFPDLYTTTLPITRICFCFPYQMILMLDPYPRSNRQEQSRSDLRLPGCDSRISGSIILYAIAIFRYRCWDVYRCNKCCNNCKLCDGK